MMTGSYLPLQAAEYNSSRPFVPVTSKHHDRSPYLGFANVPNVRNSSIYLDVGTLSVESVTISGRGTVDADAVAVFGNGGFAYRECESHAHSMRSTSVKRRRGRRDRFTSVSCCRSARISRCNDSRDRTMNRSEWSSEKTKDATTRGYRRTCVTSIDATRTVIFCRRNTRRERR